MKIYVASSWRNKYQPDIIKLLREEGHSVYDFRHPHRGNHGFHWSAIDSKWESWTPREYLCGLQTRTAERGFNLDFDAMHWAQAGVLVLPAGRSAHLEAGYFVGAGKPLVVYLPRCERPEPELMYLMAAKIALIPEEILQALQSGARDAGWNRGRP